MGSCAKRSVVSGWRSSRMFALDGSGVALRQVRGGEVGQHPVCRGRILVRGIEVPGLARSLPREQRHADTALAHAAEPKQDLVVQAIAPVLAGQTERCCVRLVDEVRLDISREVAAFRPVNFVLQRAHVHAYTVRQHLQVRPGTLVGDNKCNRGTQVVSDAADAVARPRELFEEHSVGVGVS